MTPTPCPACAACELDPTCGSYRSECPGCHARVLARGDDYLASEARGMFTGGYRRLLEDAFGDEPGDAEAGHRMVRHWVDVQTRGTK